MNATAPTTTCSNRADQLAASFFSEYCFLLSANMTNPPETDAPTISSTDTPVNKLVESVQMTDGCSVATSFKYAPFSGSSDAPYPVVVNVSKIASVGLGGSSTMRLIISNCNGSESFNTTETGVFVMRSPEFFITFERAPKSKTPPYCPGTDRVEYAVTPLQSYCQNHTSFAECGSQEKANASASSSTPPAASSKAPAVKHNVLLAVFSACVMLTSALMSI